MLPGSRTPRARAALDLGAVSPDITIPGITLVFRRSTAQEATLQQLLVAQQDTASPLYHHWLNPETFAARFGVAEQDIAATEAWLASHGFHIDSVARSRDRITFSGTAAQVQGAFGAALHHYQTGGELHFAPAADLTLPAELASITSAVLHLSDFRPKPNVKAQTRPRPDFTALSTQAHYLTPKDIATMYDLNVLYQEQYSGMGQGLAVVGQSFVNYLDLSAFQAEFSPASHINYILVPGSGVVDISPGDEGESDIDLEYASGIAQDAAIFLVYVGDNQNYNVFDSLSLAITEDIAPVVSISYGICESLLSTTDLDQSNALFEEASAQGQTLVASAGDSGATACASYTTAEGVTLAQQQALAVGFPASSPNVTAVGGTQMAAGTFAAGNSSYWASATNSDLTSSLLSYVPEVVWNEDSTKYGIAAGGGGASASFQRPAWQSGVPGIPNGNYRLLPDIALQSSIASPGFLLCSSDPALIGPGASSCSDGLIGSNDKYTLAGGTSFAAPIFAGFIAILNQAENATGQGNINPVLYGLAANPTSYAAVFHDITTGTNACSAGDDNCSTAGQSNFTATVGFDEATGLGSIDFNALAKAWSSGTETTLLPTIVSFPISPTATAGGDTVSLQIFVDPGYTQDITVPIATGSVSVSVDGAVVTPSLPLSPYEGSRFDASATFTFIAPTTTGSHIISATYSGDATHASSAAIYPMPVGNAVASGSITLAAGSLTIANGATGSTQVTVTPASGYSGRVVWSLAYTGGSGSLTACYNIASLPVNNTSTTQLTLGIGTACNAPLPTGAGDLRPLGRLALADNSSPYDSQARPRATPTAAIYVGLLLCGLLASRRRKLTLPLLLAIITLTFASLGLSGCGGGGTNTPTPPTTPSTVYTITLKGTDSVNTSITASTTFTLTVN